MNIILGSKSPQRFELMQSILAGSSLRVLPPSSDNEPGFDDVHCSEQIEDRLRLVVKLKREDVLRQLPDGQLSASDVLVCADTIVVVSRSPEKTIVLGKPPDIDWQPTVRAWFQQYYAGQTHEVWTGCSVSRHDQVRELIVKTRVGMSQLDDHWIDWYLSTGEPVGKAGGYGIQGHAATLINFIDGSLTNVVGLPTMEIAAVLRQFEVIDAHDG